MPLGSRYSANSTGGVTYGNNVLYSIITLAAQEISGVASLAGKGVLADTFDGVVNVDVFINVTNKVCCTEVAFRVQENIKRSVDSMTNYKTGTVNVNVMGLVFDGEGELEPSGL